jgi:hypothetical protein
MLVTENTRDAAANETGMQSPCLSPSRKPGKLNPARLTDLYKTRKNTRKKRGRKPLNSLVGETRAEYAAGTRRKAEIRSPSTDEKARVEITRRARSFHTAGHR